MQTRIQKWGNSLALRIPKSFALETGLQLDSAVEIVVEDGKLVISPIPAETFKLEDLLQQITADNLHSEIDAGAATGKESW